MRNKHKDQGIQKASGDKSMPTFKGPHGNRSPRTAGQPGSSGHSEGPVHFHGGNITPSATGHCQPGMRCRGGNVVPT